MTTPDAFTILTAHLATIEEQTGHIPVIRDNIADIKKQMSRLREFQEGNGQPGSRQRLQKLEDAVFGGKDEKSIRKILNDNQRWVDLGKWVAGVVGAMIAMLLWGIFTGKVKVEGM